MSKVKIQGNASGTGVLTVTAPNTSTDRTITLPDSTGTLATTADVPSSITDNGDATAITIDSSEKIGIGTSSPARLLTVYGDTGIALQNSTTGTGTGNGSHIWVNSEGSGELLIQNRENSDIEFLTNDTERMRILAGGGLTFNGDTAAANALDDYEEGTYTYTITGSSGGSMTPRSGYNHFAYTKIGRLVTVQGRFETSGSHTASGTLYVSLPFSSHDGVSHSAQGAGVVSIYRAGANFNNVRAVVRNNSSQFEFYYNEGGTGDSDATVQGSDVDATIEGSLSITYMT